MYALVNFKCIFRLTRISFDFLITGGNNVVNDVRTFIEELGVDRGHIDLIEAECAQCKFI